MHTALPVLILYLPAMQAVHVPPSGPVCPILHVQAVRAGLALGELELLGHVRQVAASVAPTVVEYFAAAQSLHAAPPVSILYLPAMHDVHGVPVDPAAQLAAHATLQAKVIPEPRTELSLERCTCNSPELEVYVPGKLVLDWYPSGSSLQPLAV